METLNRESLILNRDLAVEENYVIFDFIFENKNLILSNQDNFSVLISGLYDDSDELSYTSNLLNLVREYQEIFGTQKYILEILQNIHYAIPHGIYWSTHLLIDILTIIEKDAKMKWEHIVEKLNAEQKELLLSNLLFIKSDSDYEMTENKTMRKMLSILS
jgi:hypothetical protein